MARNIATIGFGEAAQAFATGWGPAVSGHLASFDAKIEEAAAALPLMAAAERLGVQLCQSQAEALGAASHVFSLVTADQAVAAAEQAAGALRPGALWLDCNSCAPDSKRRAAEIVVAAGGLYVDVAVMAPVHPRLHRTPLLISGPGAETAEPFLADLGMNARRLDTRVGSASAVKMIRSVMIKGLEALTAECFLAAERAGVADHVMGSLTASNPEMDWPTRGAYNLERMMQHGLRRAAEMREVVVTLDGLGLPSALTGAVADWHERIGAMGLAGKDGDLDERVAMILSRL